MFITWKKSTSSLVYFLRCCKHIANLLFSELWECLTIPSKSQYQFVGHFHSYLDVKINSILHVFLKILQKYWKLVVLDTLGMPGHTHNMIVSTRRRLQCLSACQKYNSSFTFFLRYYILKNPVIWLADSILDHNLRTTILPDMGLVLQYQ